MSLAEIARRVERRERFSRTCRDSGLPDLTRERGPFTRVAAGRGGGKGKGNLTRRRPSFSGNVPAREIIKYCCYHRDFRIVGITIRYFGPAKIVIAAATAADRSSSIVVLQTRMKLLITVTDHAAVGGIH